jgi:hypothetical protein
MNERSHDAQNCAQPPNNIVASADVKQPSPEPDTDKAADLMPEKYDTI